MACIKDLVQSSNAQYNIYKSWKYSMPRKDVNHTEFHSSEIAEEKNLLRRKE